ncbi:hypothetical protein P8C59_007707 [Phyllachora maydis]|uniref:O-fucosyltransferase family protein n=1 Tax=Phyllachora maydis TaxID=1825666 RepID=A0AAD9IAU6_9PEZI|nr:hypothetical protein P8C59_007707 [Phyllachora maydis]
MVPAMVLSRRFFATLLLVAILLFFWADRFLLPSDYRLPWLASSTQAGVAYGLPPHVDAYFDQAFSIGPPRRLDYGGIRDHCAAVDFKPDVYIDCVAIVAGLTSVASQLKVCFKMAIESGANLVLPNMPLRDSTDLREFNLMHPDKYMVYDAWFDADHLRDVLARACPQIKVLHPQALDTTHPVAHRWEILCKQARGYVEFNSLFWAGRPYGPFFDEELAKLQAAAAEDDDDDNKTPGITVVHVDPKFLLFRITDDASGRDLRLWNDFSRIIRFRAQPRAITARVVAQLAALGRPYYGVHFRTENDTIWSGFENQLALDLDGLDRAWAHLGGGTAERPLVYLACGDQRQADRFVAAGAARGWEVTHKWKMLERDGETTAALQALAFDFQGAVDLGVMVRAAFFLGITGSAFSSTVANLRDATGRYRGSSFRVPDDAGARTHLFNDGDASGYACCL